MTSSNRIGPGSAGGVTRTGLVVSRSTRSVVEPKNSFRAPVTPWLLITIKSQERSLDTRRISGTGFPRALTFDGVPRGGVVCESLRDEAGELALAVLRPPDDPGAQVEGLGEQRILDDQRHDAVL